MTGHSRWMDDCEEERGQKCGQEMEEEEKEEAHSLVSWPGSRET
jgi:hypothetical protein